MRIFGSFSRAACAVRKRGFTLVEILTAVLVMAVIAGIAIPRFKGVQDESKKAQAQSELKVLQAALKSYRVHHLYKYPAGPVFALI